MWDLVRRSLVLSWLNRQYGLSLLTAVVGLITALTSLICGSQRITVAAILILLFGVFRLVWGWNTAMKKGRSLERDARDPGPLPSTYESPYDEWLVCRHEGVEVVYSPELNAQLSAGAFIALHKQHKRWLPSIEPAREFARYWPTRAGFINGQKIRLSSDLVATSETVTIQRTDYAAYIVTNNLAVKEVFENGVRRLTLEDVVLRPDTRKVRRFSDSHASNHMGGDILAVSPRRFFLQTQGATEVSPGLRVASGSGSFDYRDMWGCADLVSLVKRGVMREMREELGLRRWSRAAPGADDVRVVGFSRATYMGGKPQFYAVARVSDGIRPRRRSAENGWLERAGTPVEFDPEAGATDFVRKLQSLRALAGPNFAPSLVILIEMLDVWLEEADNAEWLFPSAQKG